MERLLYFKNKNTSWREWRKDDEEKEGKRNKSKRNGWSGDETEQANLEIEKITGKSQRGL